MKRRITDIQTIPFRGGMNASVEPNLLPSGGYSAIYNMRGKHPGFEQRKGQAAQHTVADTPNRVQSLYQFRKGKLTERHLFAQMSDGDVLKATTAPPGTTTGAFGSEVLDGTANQIPASWGNINDVMVFSNGVDNHKLWPGNNTYVNKFVVVKATAAIPTIPTEGEDYSDEISDGLATTVAVLDSLSTLANHDAVFIGTLLPANQFTWTILAANGDAAAAQMHYWNGAFTAVSSFVDNTSADSKTLATTGATMTWTHPADEIPKYQFGACMFWYRLSLSSGALDAEVEVSSLQYESSWQNLVNVWDGVPLEIIEFQYYDQSADVYKTFSAGSIEIDSATSSDIFYFATADNIEAFYVDVGKKPNTTASTTINAGSYWDGSAWQAASIVDGTNGLSQSGWVWIGRNATAKPRQFAGTEYYAYWWKFTVDQTLNDDVIISMMYMPYFDVSELGKGYSNAVWKDRVCYSFDRWGQYLYITARDGPNMLNGDDYGILEAGDGRSNKVVAQRRFHNELMVWQQELGAEGGCLTLFEGYSPTTFGKLLLSSRLGAMNNNCVEVIDGVLTSTATEERIKTLAFALSRYGVYVSDGQTCSFIDDQIRIHFDPTDTTNCIRLGYENLMWLKHDSAYNVIRIGLVCGSSATVPNVFLVFDLKDKAWSYDSLAQELSCMTEAEAASGNIPVLQIGGGVDDGTVYQLNTGANDVSTAIDSYVRMELDARGEKFRLAEMILRMKVQAAGNVTITPYNNAVSQTAMTLAMTAEDTNETIRRHREPLNLVGHHLSLKIQNNTVSQSLYLEDIGLQMEAYGEQ
uniref:Uncharacterized protein n=1 Tax=viral metagenome TaxID=1070528 RepID=A0A6M3IME5_9ZZZZ